MLPFGKPLLFRSEGTQASNDRYSSCSGFDDAVDFSSLRGEKRACHVVGVLVG